MLRQSDKMQIHNSRWNWFPFYHKGLHVLVAGLLNEDEKISSEPCFHGVDFFCENASLGFWHPKIPRSLSI